MPFGAWRLLAVAAAVVAAAGLQTAPPVAQSPATRFALILDGFARLDENRIDEAQPYFERALALARELGDRRLEAHAHRGFGRMWAHKGDHAAARAALDRAIALFEALDDILGLAQAWNQVGINAYFSQRWPEAVEGYRRALAAFGQAGLPGEEADVLRNLTFVPTLAREERLGLIARAVDRAAAAKQPALEGLSLHVWGDLLVGANDYAGAMAKLAAARTLLEANGTALQLARLYTSIGRMYRLHGEPALAVPYYERAIAQQRALRDVEGEVQTLNAIAIANHVLGRTRAARDAYTQALALARQSRRPGVLAWMRRQFGLFLIESGEPALGAPQLEEGLRAEVETSERAQGVSGLARAYLTLGRDAEAESAAAEAVKLAAGGDSLDAQRSAHMARARVHRAAGRSVAAVADTRETLRLVEQQRPSLVAEDALRVGFGERIRHVFDFAVSLFSEAEQHEDALVASEQGRARAFLELLASRRVAADEASTAAPVSMSLDQLKATAARLSSAVLSYWVTPWETTIWLVLPDGSIRSHVVRVTRSRIDGLVSRAADADNEAWRALYDLLILPMRRWLPPAGDALLTIVPDGPLYRLPFGALRNERGRYLLEGYQLHYTSAISALAPDPSERALGDGTDRLLVIANPTLTAATDSGVTLPPLSGAFREARAIAGRLVGSPVDILRGRDATETRVRADAALYDVIHIAAHGIVRDDRPMDSFLALATEAETADDGRLTADEIQTMSLRASLVVLSACKSAAGRVTGDGIVGLTRAFMAAGVRSVVSSAWDLPDETTPRLFESFYAARARGRATAASLREAQLALLGALRRGQITVGRDASTFVVPEHPRVWAGLMLWGDPGHARR